MYVVEHIGVTQCVDSIFHNCCRRPVGANAWHYNVVLMITLHVIKCVITWWWPCEEMNCSLTCK